ncbi:TonB-dependent receptor [Flavobacterium sp. DGU11]|uniref:TonB-dependent receptor n=1 Tax=Flavobacterium arundinis TaxID=3139143 RepID=A0ABU9HV59_9FLAO
MKKLIFHLAILCITFSYAQEKDSIQVLEEVIVIGRKKDLNLKQAKPLTTIDDYLQQSGNITMIKRGGYAWEPVLNSMATERTLVTIEGMHIFGACTDKMDPVTSYVEVSNLSEATITSGQHGSGYGATIGGSVDLKRNRNYFTNPGWKTMLNTGYESVNNQKIAGAAISYAESSFYADTDIIYRDAGNYKAGNNNQVLFSQFRKLNLSGTAGFRLGINKILEASAIYDKANDVGYPALPMDVSLAEALITSAKLEVKPVNSALKTWETKLYYNSVTHIMDDTKRPFVPMHMDMPGETQTYGGYSALMGSFGKHSFKVNYNSYYNRSYAEMTMYPSNPDENSMFMLTWPDVRTFFNGLYLEDNYEFNCHSFLKLTASAGLHSNTVQSQSGLESMQIFYRDAEKTKSRLLKSIAISYTHKKDVEITVGAGYGERAPSVSEGYGFYLFNSFDNYDYVGNPGLSNEKSLEGNVAVAYRKEKGTMKLSASYFHIKDYIIGKPDTALLPMTLGADGIKIYTALPYASIFNTALDTEYKISEHFNWQTQLAYSLGRDNNNHNLPFISPFRYTTSIAYRHKSFSSELVLYGNAQQSNYAAEYGEDGTASFAIVNYNAGYLFYAGKYKIQARTGLENIFDAYYSTFGDWNNIPRPGRNFFINVIFYN